MMVELTTQTPSATTAAELRAGLVAQLRDAGDILSAAVADAFDTVPRHAFAPIGTSLDNAYSNDSLATKRDADGRALSTISAPWVQARKLELAGLEPGMRVLEIGSGGYNAALMSEVVGETGSVTSVDIDPEITDAASERLAENGYGDRVRVVCGDGARAAADHAPAHGWDAIIVTAQAPDIPPAWADTLAPGGTLVVPLTLRAIHRVLAFRPAEEERLLRSVGSTQCGFVGMRGELQHTGRTVELAGPDLRLGVEDDAAPDAAALAATLSGPHTTEWTQVPLYPQEGALPALDFWLAGQLPTYGRVYATSAAVQRGLAGWTIAAAATWTADSIAYTTIRPTDGATELGVHAWGPDRGTLAQEMAGHIRAWHAAGRRLAPEPTVLVYPPDTSTDHLAPGIAISKRMSRLVIAGS